MFSASLCSYNDRGHCKSIAAHYATIYRMCVCACVCVSVGKGIIFIIISYVSLASTEATLLWSPQLSSLALHGDKLRSYVIKRLNIYYEQTRCNNLHRLRPSHVGTVHPPNLSVIRNPRTRLRLRLRPRPSRSRVQLQSQLNALAGQGSPPSIVYRLSPSSSIDPVTKRRSLQRPISVSIR